MRDLVKIAIGCILKDLHLNIQELLERAHVNSLCVPCYSYLYSETFHPRDFCRMGWSGLAHNFNEASKLNMKLVHMTN